MSRVRSVPKDALPPRVGKSVAVALLQSMAAGFVFLHDAGTLGVRASTFRLDKFVAQGILLGHVSSTQQQVSNESTNQNANDKVDDIHTHQKRGSRGK